MPKLTEQLAAPLRQMQVGQPHIDRFQVMLEFALNLNTVCVSGVRQEDRQGLRRRQAGGGRGDVHEPVQAAPHGRGVRLGQRSHLRPDLQDDRRL